MKCPLPLLLLLPATLICCDEGSDGKTAPLSPQEMYEKGRSFLKPNIEQGASDFAKALEWTRKAAEAGLQRAQTDLGGLYMYGGKGISIDGAEALKWFSRAAAQGSRESEVFIGDIYQKGLGVKADIATAMEHWRVAADAGIAEAQQRLGHELVRHPRTFSEGLNWLKKAALEGVANGKAAAACDLGTIYARGHGGIKPDLQEAARWYSIAAEEGNAAAQHVYGIMLLTGEPVTQDEKAGLFMLRRAASQDYLPAIADFIRYLRNAPNATDGQKKEAEAWNQRLEELQEKRRTKSSQPEAGVAR